MNTKLKSKKPTYRQIILNHMLAGKTLSNMQAYKLYNMTCFTRCVSALRAEGVPIQDVFIKRNGKKFKIYWINKTNRDKFCEVAQ